MTPAASSRTIPLDLIDVDDRLRPEDAAYVEILAASMAEVGQIEAIELRPNPAKPGRFLLTAGLHRLRAVERNGWTSINAKIVERGPDEARLVEIDENLMRRELGALDRAIFLAERKRVWEAMYPETAHGKAPKSLKNQGGNKVAKMATRFSKEVEERTGLSERTVRRAVALAADLSPEIVRLIRGSYLENHAADLEKLRDLPFDEQLEAAQNLASGKIKRLREHRPPARLPADEAQFQKLLDHWSRASTKARRRFARYIGYAPDPKAGRDAAILPFPGGSE